MPMLLLRKLKGRCSRAGLDPSSSPFEELILALAKSQHVRIYGFYSHAGTSVRHSDASDPFGLPLN